MYELNPLSYDELIKEYDILELPCSFSTCLKQHMKSNDEREISKLLSSLVDQVIEDEISNINELYLNYILSNQMVFNTTTDFSQLPSKLYKFYIQNIQLDTMSIKKIFNQTITQSFSELWNDQRRIRISASIKAHKIKTSKDLSPIKQNKLAKLLCNEVTIQGKGAINVSYGIKTEKKALKVYSDILNVEVLESGLIIHKQMPWICCSPDGIVLKNGQPDRVLEIKCPISHKDKPFINSIDGKVTLKYLKYNLSNELILNTSSMYYTQCQILMMCTGLKKCDLFIYNNIKPLTLTIQRNDSFLIEISKKIENFYFNYYLQNLNI